MKNPTSLLGYKNAVKYSSYLKNRIISSLSKYKSKDLIETVEFVVNRKKWQNISF